METHPLSREKERKRQNHFQQKMELCCLRNKSHIDVSGWQKKENERTNVVGTSQRLRFFGLFFSFFLFSLLSVRDSPFVCLRSFSSNGPHTFAALFFTARLKSVGASELCLIFLRLEKIASSYFKAQTGANESRKKKCSEVCQKTDAPF